MILISEEKGLPFPNLREVYKKEIINVYQKLDFHGNFSDSEKFMFSTSYYCLGMIIHYTEKGNGKIPQNVLKEIINQVIDVSKSIFPHLDQPIVWQSLTDTIMNKLNEKNIINETKVFWDKYYL